jgi:hypothetical protein
VVGVWVSLGAWDFWDFPRRPSIDDIINFFLKMFMVISTFLKFIFRGAFSGLFWDFLGSQKASLKLPKIKKVPNFLKKKSPPNQQSIKNSIQINHLNPFHQ